MPNDPARLRPAAALVREVRNLLISLKLTVALLVFSLVLIFAATWDQQYLGIWAVQEKYFRAFVVYHPIGPVVLPLFPGGYTIGGLLLANLIVAHVYRFKLSWRKTGIFLTHLGLIVLLVGELLTGIWQKDFFLSLDEGQTKNYAESFQHIEFAIIDTTNPVTDEVVAIPERLLARKEPIQHPRLPFRVQAATYYHNSTLRVRSQIDAPSAATIGIGDQIAAAPLPITYKQNERNVPTAFVEFSGVDGPIGTFLVSPHLAEPQEFAHAGRTWRIALRAQRTYLPAAFTLLDFTHDRYPGTEIPKNFSSRVKLTTAGGNDDREVLIWMNNPLRHAGFTFYQAGFENNDRTTVLQVVRNPSWLMPYVACSLVTLGLLVQFGIHLVGFVGGRRSTVAGRGAISKPGVGAPAAPALAPAMRFLVPGVALAVLAFVALTLRMPRNPSDYDVAGFGRVPVLLNGRIKPIDTVARTSLLMLQGRQRVTAPDGQKLAPVEWLLDVLCRPAQADTYQTFEIVHPEVLALLNLSAEGGAGSKRFSFTQIRPGIMALDRQAKLADGTEPPLRTPFQRAVVQLRNGVLLYQRLQSSLAALEEPGFFADLVQWAPRLASLAAEPSSAHAAPDAKRILELASAFATMDKFAYFRVVPPAEGGTDHEWKTMGAAWAEALGNGKLAPAARILADIGRAWHDRDFAAFNRSVAELQMAIDRAVPEHVTRSRAEIRFNAAQPFYTSAMLYVVAFLLAVVSWLRWPAALSRSAFVVLLGAFALTTVGIVTRMWLEGRPPVTNLYSSALFVGWAAVALCVMLEKVYRNAIGSVAGAAIGFATLLIAHHLALGGDTMEMMRAVLDSNFWLATHVVTISIGYSATFLAGMLAIVYVVRGVLTRSMDAVTDGVLARMIYGIVCFATLFSFVGTILGGIWADQSWGRFWGWDPKENGALLIVIWNAVILHVRWARLVNTRGLACLAIFGNIVTAWSWFGVNMLGVGLHSYGFMDAAFWWLIAFVASQLALILVAAVPLRRWRSSSALA